MTPIQEIQKNFKDRCESFLKLELPCPQITPVTLHQAMSYSLLSQGKRLRAGLVYTLGQVYNVDLERLDYPAAAIEMIHTFSLIHDDLPALDNDDLRRGKPTCHQKFGEDVAILAGDALHTQAFITLTSIPNCKPNRIVDMVRILAESTGSQGLIGGELLDLEAENGCSDHSHIDHLFKIYEMKTGNLFAASLKLAYLCSNNTCTMTLQTLEKIGLKLGVAFQIQDDILEIESTHMEIGKSTTSDLINHKITSVTCLGLEAAKHIRDIFLNESIDLIHTLKIKDKTLIDFCNVCVIRAF